MLNTMMLCVKLMVWFTINIQISLISTISEDNIALQT